MIIRNHTEKIIYWLLPLFYFMVPISTFGTSVCLFGLILVWLITGDLKKKGVLYWQHPVVRVFLILILGLASSIYFTIDMMSKRNPKAFLVDKFIPDAGVVSFNLSGMFHFFGLVAPLGV